MRDFWNACPTAGRLAGLQGGLLHCKQACLQTGFEEFPTQPFWPNFSTCTGPSKRASVNFKQLEVTSGDETEPL